MYMCLKVCGPPSDHHHVGGGRICNHPKGVRGSLIWYKPMYNSNVFLQSVQSIAMVSQTTRYVSCSCFWQTIHLEGRSCWVQSHGVDCQHGGGNLMLYTSRYHDIKHVYIYIYLYVDTHTWYPVLHIADLRNVALRLLLGLGLHLSERRLHRVSLTLYTKCIFQGTIACFNVPTIIFQSTLVYPAIPSKFQKNVVFNMPEPRDSWETRATPWSRRSRRRTQGHASDIVRICQSTNVYVSAYMSMMHCHASITRAYCNIYQGIN